MSEEWPECGNENITDHSGNWTGCWECGEVIEPDEEDAVSSEEVEDD